MKSASSLLAVSGLLSCKAATLAQLGDQVHCVGERAHVLRYDVAGEANDGSSLEGIERAIISLEPSAAHGELCSDKTNGLRKDGLPKHTPEGEKQFCYGANQDSTCTAAANELPINSYFGCKDCFASVSADAFYSLDYSAVKLNRISAGLNNTQLRASASLHSLLKGQATDATGSIPVFGSQTFKIIDKLVGCPVCVKVKIEVAVPTTIDYSLKVSGDVDLQAGLALDVDLRNNFVTFDANAGWSYETHSDPGVTVTPLLAAKANAQGNFLFDVKTQVQVNIDDIFWYHLTLNPSISGKLSFKGDATVPSGDLCLDGTAKFSMTQEADLNWDLWVWKAQDHWGPKALWSWQLPTPVHRCKSFGSPAAMSSNLSMVSV